MSNTKPIFLFKYIKLEEFHPKETFLDEKNSAGQKLRGKVGKKIKITLSLQNSHPKFVKHQGRDSTSSFSDFHMFRKL